MVDIEALDTRPTAAIISIGACKFSWATGVTDTFYINVDGFDSKKHGLTVNSDTIEWWKKQSKEAIGALTKNPTPVTLKTALEKFSHWVESDKHSWWCNGANFDFPILLEAYKRVGMEPPWKYYNLNCFRTVVNLFGVNTKKLRAADAQSVAHNAIDDVLFQTKTLIGILGEFKNQ